MNFLPLDIRVQRIEEDILSNAFRRDAEATATRLIEPARKVFMEDADLRIDLRTIGVYKRDEARNGLRVYYVTPQEYVEQKSPTLDAALERLDEKKMQAVLLGRKLVEALAKLSDEPVDVSRMMLETIWKNDRASLDRNHGVADREAHIAYLLSNGHNRDYVQEVQANNREEAYIRLYGVILAHELGHLFGLEHATGLYLPDGRINIMKSGMSRSAFQSKYGFSDADKAKIRAQICEGEQQ